MRRPDFFIVGAPKAGTTALHAALRRHPEIFMPERKEPHFFGTDLEAPYPYFIRDESEYLSLFRPATDERRVGECSVWYLYSKRAAAEIAAFSPSARIVAVLRDPVEMVYSLHSQRVYSGNEPIADFEAALAAEPRRKRGIDVPEGVQLVEGLFYRDVGRYCAQVERYLDGLGRDRVHVILYDDLRRRPPETLRALLRFLDVDPTVPLDLPHANVNRRVRSARLQGWIRTPPSALAAVGRLILPEPWRRRIVDLVYRHNAVTAPRPPMDPELRRRLRAGFASDVRCLGELLGRDLTGWIATGEESTAAALSGGGT